MLFQVFLRATHRMEGDHSSGALLLQEYDQVLDELTSLSNTTKYASIYRMINIMKAKLTVYQAEALRCDSVILATTLNPRCRTRFFDKLYPAHAERAKNLLREKFSQTLADHLETQNNQTNPTTSSTTEAGASTTSTVSSSNKYDVYASDSELFATDHQEELEMYMNGKNPAKSADHLAWWQVRDLISFFSSSLTSILTLLFVIIRQTHKAFQ
jgi:hypothetical protein